MRSLEIIVCSICLIWAITATEAPGPALEALNNVKNVLIAFNKAFKQCAPLTVYHKKLQDFTRNHTGLSNKGGELAGQLTTMLLNTDSEYFQATRSVKGFCGESGPLLEGFVQLFEGYSPDAADAQKDLLLGILLTADDKLGKACVGLVETVTNFNAASRKLDDLLVQLTEDFNEDSEFFKSEVKAAKAEAALNAFTNGPPSSQYQIEPNVTRTPPTKNGDNEKEDVNIAKDLKKTFAETEQFYVDLKKQMSDAGKIEFESTDNKIKARIAALKGSTTRVRTIGVAALDAGFPAILSAVNGFTAQCKDSR